MMLRYVLFSASALACALSLLPRPTDAKAGVPGGILLWAQGRVASETFYANLNDTARGALLAEGASGEAFKHSDGVPTSGFDELMAAGKRYVHVKPQHLSFGYGTPGRIQSPEELFRRASAAGFTLVLTLHRSNQFAQMNSRLLYDNGIITQDEIRERVNSVYCKRHPNVVEVLASERDELRHGLVVAREEGLRTAVTTTEAVVRDACGVARHVLALYNKASVFQVSNATGTCRDAVVVSSQQVHRTLEERIGRMALDCVREVVAAAPEYAWMLEDEGYRLDPPAMWRRLWDGIEFESTARPNNATTVFGIADGAWSPSALRR